MSRHWRGGRGSLGILDNGGLRRPLGPVYVTEHDGYRSITVTPCTCWIHGTRASGVAQWVNWTETVRYRRHCCGRVV